MMTAFAVACSSVAASAQPSPDRIRAAIASAGGAEQFMAKLAKATAAGLPKKTNANVEMVSVSAVKKNLQFLVKLINVAASDVYNVDELKRANVNWAGCRTPVFSILISEHNAEIVYSAVSNDAQYLFEYRLNSVTCKGK